MKKPQRIKSHNVPIIETVEPQVDKSNSVVEPQVDNPKNDVVEPQVDKKKHVVEPQVDKPKTKKTTNSSGHLPIKDITTWAHADRLEEEFGESEEWHEFVQSIKYDGVDQPVTVRKKKGGKGYELICGRRRYTACLECGHETIPAIIRDLSDTEALALQDRENQQRKSISAWGRSIHWHKLLESGVFETQEKLGAAMGVERKYVSKLLTFSRVDEDIAKAIVPKFKVTVKTAIAIISLTRVTDDQPKNVVDENKRIIIELADKIASGSLNDVKLKAAIAKFRNGQETIDQQPEFDSNIGIIKGVKCFNVRRDSNGTPVISVLKDARDLVTVEDIAEHLGMLFEDAIK